jgi:hypothetical protein
MFHEIMAELWRISLPLTATHHTPVTLRAITTRPFARRSMLAASASTGPRGQNFTFALGPHPLSAKIMDFPSQNYKIIFDFRSAQGQRLCLLAAPCP